MVSYNLVAKAFLSEMIVPYGYTDQDSSDFGFWSNITAIFAGLLSSYFIAKTGHYKYTTVFIIVMTMLATVAFQMSV